ncbi:hypothetical protein D3C77_460210 [compost metagenome]
MPLVIDAECHLVQPRLQLAVFARRLAGQGLDGDNAAFGMLVDERLAILLELHSADPGHQLIRPHDPVFHLKVGERHGDLGDDLFAVHHCGRTAHVVVNNAGERSGLARPGRHHQQHGPDSARPGGKDAGFSVILIRAEFDHRPPRAICQASRNRQRPPSRTRYPIRSTRPPLTYI